MASLNDILDAAAAGLPNPAKPADPVDPSVMTSLSIENLQAKLDRIRQASIEKSAHIAAQRQAIAAQTDQVMAEAAANANSWVGKLGLNPDGVVGGLVNLASGAIAGGSRQLLGASLALPHTAAAMAGDASISQEDTDAYNRYVQGKATPEDMLRLNSTRNPAGGVTGYAAAKASMSANGPTALQLIQQANASRQVARKINDAFNIDSIEHQGSKNQLDAALGDAFSGDFSTIKDAISSFKAGHYLDAAGSGASGLGQLLFHTGEAALNNKMGVAQYVAENAPQLLVGTLGFAGKAGMTASNLGYAADYYQQGMENYAKAHGGALPDVAERQRIAAWAASLAAAEEVGDRIGLAAMKTKGAAKSILGLGEGASNMATDVAAQEAAKTGMLQSLKHTLLAAAEGAGGETLTEGYQGYAEDVTARKRAYNDFGDAALQDIYKNAVIGGLSGGVLSGGVHGISEMVGATPEKAQIRQKAAEKAQIFDESVKNNDPAPFLDPNGPHFDPIQAVQVYAQHNLSDAATPDSRDQNVMKAAQVLQNLGEQEKTLAEQRNSSDPAEAKAAAEQFKVVNAQIKQGQVVWNRMFDESQHLNAQDTANTPNAPVQNTPEAALNLSMAAATKMTPQEAINMAEDKGNGLSDEQRSYLRAFSDARLAHNAAQSMGSITNTILNGDKKTGDLGLTDYRSRIGMSVATGNQDRASYDLGMLSRFATSHAEKAAVAEEGVKQFGRDVQIYKTDQGWGYAAPGTYSASKLKQGGQLNGVSPRLLEAMQKEAKAIAATRDEMTQAVRLKFGTTQNTSPAVQSNLTSAAPTTSAAPLVSPASLFREKREREGRVKEGEPSSPLSPQSSLPVGEGKSVTSVAQQPQQNKEISSAVSPSSPGLQPSAPIAADAAQGTAAAPGSAETSPVRTQETAKQPVDAPASTPAAAAVSASENNSSKQEAGVVTSGKNSHTAAKVDTGEDIPEAHFEHTMVPHQAWVRKKQAFHTIQVTAAQALASVRDDISKLEDLIKCMKG